jgi:hypothetical protein
MRLFIIILLFPLSLIAQDQPGDIICRLNTPWLYVITILPDTMLCEMKQVYYGPCEYVDAESKKIRYYTLAFPYDSTAWCFRIKSEAYDPFYGKMLLYTEEDRTGQDYILSGVIEDDGLIMWITNRRHKFPSWMLSSSDPCRGNAKLVMR